MTRKTSLVLLVTAAAHMGCGSLWPTVSPATEQEMFALTETLRFAAQTEVKVDAVLTDTLYLVSTPDTGTTYAAAWYYSGTVYWYRPWTAKQSFAVITEIAAHEVCHVYERAHNTKHLECQATLLRGLPYKG